MIELREILEAKDYHPERIVSDTPITQTFWYGAAQERRGRKVHRLIISRDSEDKLLAQFIEYPIGHGLSYWYAPYGPMIKDPSEALIRELDKDIRERARGSKIVFVRLDFTPEIKDVTKVFTKVSRISGYGSYYQPRYEWYKDVSSTPDEILMSMHQKTRYSVRLAEKKSIKTRIVSGGELGQSLGSFIKVMQETATRNDFKLHDDDYYQCMFDEIARSGRGFLVEAYLGEELLASHLVVLEGKIAHYLFGGSSDSHKELCAPYLAHYQGMLESKRRGALIYNFGGISENGSAPHWESITTFKKRFGGYAHAHGQYHDVVLKPFWYHLYNIRKFVKSLF